MAPRIMLQFMQMMFTLIRSLFASKSDLALEVLALRQPFDSAALHSGQATRRLQTEATTAAVDRHG